MSKYKDALSKQPDFHEHRDFHGRWAQHNCETIKEALEIAEKLESDNVIPDSWPQSGRETNVWNKDAASFTDLIQRVGNFWCVDMQLKYLNLRIDTRSGDFIIFDRDNNKVPIDRVLKAMREWVEQCGFKEK